MADVQNVVDKFSGFITKEQAEYLLNGTMPNPKSKSPTSPLRVDELASCASNIDSQEISVNVKDNIYRIFNPTTTKVKGSDTVSRKLIIGEEGNTAVLNLNEKMSGFIDISSFERGDLMLAANLLYNRNTGELRCSQSTSLNRIAPTTLNVISDFTGLKGELRKVDFIGRITEIGSIRHVTRLGSSSQIALSSCIISDSRIDISASFWGSSALATTGMKPNEFIKMEFCDIRIREGKIHIYANDDSRVATNSAFSKRAK